MEDTDFDVQGGLNIRSLSLSMDGATSQWFHPRVWSRLSGYLLKRIGFRSWEICKYSLLPSSAPLLLLFEFLVNSIVLISSKRRPLIFTSDRLSRCRTKILKKHGDSRSAGSITVSELGSPPLKSHVAAALPDIADWCRWSRNTDRDHSNFGAWGHIPHPLANDSVMSHLSGAYFQVSVPTPHVYLIQANRAPVNAFNERYG